MELGERLGCLFWKWKWTYNLGDAISIQFWNYIIIIAKELGA